MLVDFAKFVRTQPAERKVNHLNPNGVAGWNFCAVGDFCREVLTNENVWAETAADELYDAEQNLTDDCSTPFMTQLSCGTTAPTTYGGIVELLNTYHPTVGVSD